MGVTDGEPEATLARRPSDYRPRVGEAWPRTEPGPWLNGLSKWKQGLRGRQQPIELLRCWRRVAPGEFDAGGNADALLHRSEHVAIFSIKDRTAERGVSPRPIMAVIAALDGKWETDANRLQHIERPRTQRDDDIAGVNRPGIRLDAPVGIGPMQRLRVALIA